MSAIGLRTDVLPVTPGTFLNYGIKICPLTIFIIHFLSKL